MKPWLLIDADSIVYKAGFAVEKTEYEVIAEDEDGHLQTATLDTYEQAGEWLVANALRPDTASVEVRRDVEPVENAIQIAKNLMQSIEQQNADFESVIYLSGPANYRDKVAKLKPYKGNRDKAHKPIYYDALRTYLSEFRMSYVAECEEADDVVSIDARGLIGAKYVIAGIDKDLDQIPGRHYDYHKHVFYDVSTEEAERNFWIQVLAGDPSDNVGGCHKIGPKTAAKLVDDGPDVFSRDMWSYVVKVYADSQKKRGCWYADKDPEAVALENAQLVYLQREFGELWLPNGERGEAPSVT